MTAYFPRCSQPLLGVYPIVSSADWVVRVVKAGAKTVQLRIKIPENSKPGAIAPSLLHIQTEIQRSNAICRAHNVMLFVNDHWRIAIEEGCFGVHLGQEDLDTADLEALERAQLRVGVSTHTPEELERIFRMCIPSYVALGPVFESQSKPEVVHRYGSQGSEAVKQWKLQIESFLSEALTRTNLAATSQTSLSGASTTDKNHKGEHQKSTRERFCPLVAIGGIDLSNAEQVVKAGADGIAMIRAITSPSDGLQPEHVIQTMQSLFENRDPAEDDQLFTNII